MKKVKLGEIADIITGPFGSMLHASDYVDAGVPSIMPQNIKNGTIDRNGIAYITKEDAKRLSNYLVVKGDIVYSRRGDVEKCAYINTNDVGALCGTGCLRIRPDSSNVNPLFLSQYLRRSQTRRWIVDHASGSLMPNLNTAILKMVPLELPDIQTQKNIASIIESFDSKIALNNKINVELESMAKTIYDYWFTQFDFPDENGRPYKSSGGKMEWNEELQREIPAGWEVKTLGDIFFFDKGAIPEELHNASDKEDNDLKYLTIDVLNNGTPQFCTCNNMPVANGETLMVMDGAASSDVYVGFEGVIASTISALRITDKCFTNEFLYIVMKKLENAFRKVNTGSTVPHANKNFICDFAICVPKNEVLSQKLILSITLIIKSIIRNRKESDKLVKLRDWLLPMLMNGQVEVTVL